MNRHFPNLLQQATFQLLRAHVSALKVNKQFNVNKSRLSLQMRNTVILLVLARLYRSLISKGTDRNYPSFPLKNYARTTSGKCSIGKNGQKSRLDMEITEDFVFENSKHTIQFRFKGGKRAKISIRRFKGQQLS